MVAMNSLYYRIGGSEVMHSLAENLLISMQQDPKLMSFFVEQSKANLHTIQHLLMEYLSEAAGGPEVYSGRSLKSVLCRLHINEAHWMRMGSIMMTVTEDMLIERVERNELLHIIASVQRNIGTTLVTFEKAANYVAALVVNQFPGVYIQRRPETESQCQ